jgi:hypothetical protein
MFVENGAERFVELGYAIQVLGESVENATVRKLGDGSHFCISPAMLELTVNGGYCGCVNFGGIRNFSNTCWQLGLDFTFAS